MQAIDRLRNYPARFPMHLRQDLTLKRYVERIKRLKCNSWGISLFCYITYNDFG